MIRDARVFRRGRVVGVCEHARIKASGNAALARKPRLRRSVARSDYVVGFVVVVIVGRVFERDQRVLARDRYILVARHFYELRRDGCGARHKGRNSAVEVVRNFVDIDIYVIVVPERGILVHVQLGKRLFGNARIYRARRRVVRTGVGNLEHEPDSSVGAADYRLGRFFARLCGNDKRHVRSRRRTLRRGLYRNRRAQARRAVCTRIEIFGDCVISVRRVGDRVYTDNVVTRVRIVVNILGVHRKPARPVGSERLRYKHRRNICRGIVDMPVVCVVVHGIGFIRIAHAVIVRGQARAVRIFQIVAPVGDFDRTARQRILGRVRSRAIYVDCAVAHAKRKLDDRHRTRLGG